MNLRWVRSALGFAAVVGFMLSLAVHVATTLSVDVYSRFQPVWVLHFVAIALLVSFLLSGGYHLKLDEVTAKVPTWAVLVVAVTGVYALVNTAVCAALSGEGNANVLQGQYVLTSHGRVLAHISERDYHFHRATELRLFSGIWLAACLVAAVYFLLWREDRSPGVSRAEYIRPTNPG